MRIWDGEKDEARGEDEIGKRVKMIQIRMGLGKGSGMEMGLE